MISGKGKEQVGYSMGVTGANLAKKSVGILGNGQF